MKQVFLFSGQGAQRPGMGYEFYTASRKAKEAFDLADQVLGRSLSHLCFQGSEEALSLTHNTQPCTFIVDWAIYQAALEAGCEAEAFAGFSLGEYVALAASGVLRFEEALTLVQFRADAMQAAVPAGEGAMAAIKECPLPLLEEACRSAGGLVMPANFNSPRQTVLSGQSQAVEQALEFLKARHVRGVLLPVSAPFHTPLLEPAREALARKFDTLDWHDAAKPVYLNVDAQKHTDKEEIKNLVLRQTISAVRWMQSILALKHDGFDYFLEMGPGHTLTGFNKAIFQDDPTITFRALEKPSDLQA